MREVIDYSKDFLSGETIERKRNKEDLNYRGIATVQLFDEKGNVVQEVKSENCINKRWLSYVYKSFFRTRLLYNKGAHLYKMTGYAGSPAQSIVLTSNTNEENDLDISMKGEMVGWANGWLSYIGEDKLRGSVNIAETTSDFLRKHFVIDFPTNAANGTFQSIYWVGSNEDTIPIYAEFKEDSYILGDKSYKYIVMNNFLYGMDDIDKPDNFYKIDLNNFKVVRAVVNEDKQNKYYRVGKYQNQIYYFTGKYANVYDENLNFIKKIDINPLDTSATIGMIHFISYDEGFILGDGYYNYSIYDGDLNEVRAIDKSFVSFSQYAFYLGDGIFMIPSRLDRNNGTPICYYDVHNDKKVFDVYGTTYYSFIIRIDDYDRNSQLRHSEEKNDYWYDWDSNKLYYLRTYNDNYYYTCAVRVPWFAHTLLPAPVTKTATNTMKIQYDFVVEERGYFD